jgi:hypothetical protein
VARGRGCCFRVSPDKSVSSCLPYTSFCENPMAALLELVPAIRAGFKHPGGGGKSERHFLDFAIAGQSLWEQLRKPDMVSVLCSEYAAAARHESVRSIRRLLLLEKADFPNNRRSLFICAEYGDPGCGAMTSLIVREGEVVIWKDFGLENTYEDNVVLAPYEGVGPFIFDAQAYEGLFLQALDGLGPSNPI